MGDTQTIESLEKHSSIKKESLNENTDEHDAVTFSPHGSESIDCRKRQTAACTATDRRAPQGHEPLLDTERES